MNQNEFNHQLTHKVNVIAGNLGGVVQLVSENPELMSAPAMLKARRYILLALNESMDTIETLIKRSPVLLKGFSLDMELPEDPLKRLITMATVPETQTALATPTPPATQPKPAPTTVRIMPKPKAPFVPTGELKALDEEEPEAPVKAAKEPIKFGRIFDPQRTTAL